ncbi:MAG: hypothetical protein VYA86_01205 [Candidatus Thermoplasmatota archaeon]|nr:hypothetical protein [Candidatus Thermoplasmatota archaeon]
MREGLAGSLQHPRRSLGDRHRSQAIKFLKLADLDANRRSENYSWAEQNSRQALLHDFTNPENWRTLAKIKSDLGDEVGLRALLTDLFAVLGRDPEQISQLDGVPILQVGRELLEAALSTDHLDPDLWHANLDTGAKEAFCARFSTLDLSDPRCNVLYGRRLERLWKSDGDEICIPLAKILLANRPQNFEMWVTLGRAHERREAYDEAWLCYDQAQNQAPHLDVRDAFRNRIEIKFDSLSSKPWTKPNLHARDDFLRRMQALALEFATSPDNTVVVIEDDSIEENEDEVNLKGLLSRGEYSVAFFLSRRLVTRGEEWASEYMNLAKSGLDSDDEVVIP